jgi:RNA polymerase sigma-32 factor
LYNLQKEKDRLIAEGYSPTPKLLAAHFDVSPEEVIAVDKSIGAKDVSLDMPTGDGGKGTLIDIIHQGDGSLEEDVINKDFYSHLHENLSEFKTSLKESDQDILANRILADDPDTLQDIADRFGITREAIRQAEKRLLGRLQKFVQEKYPDLINAG